MPALSTAETGCPMSEERRCDVAIVGGGIAGLITANRLAQLGTRAVVLEQGSEERTSVTRAIPGARSTSACATSCSKRLP